MDSLKPVEAWVSYHRVVKLLVESGKTLEQIPRLHNKDERELLKKLKIIWKNKLWEVPGMTERLHEHELREMLALKGIPEACDRTVLTPEENLSLEFHIVDYKEALRY